MDVVMMSIKDVKPYEKNPRINDNAVEAVANSIKEFGWRQPIVVDKDNTIIAGHTRYKAAKMLKMKEVPVIVASDLDEEHVKAYRLADNKVGETAMWDYDLLDAELFDIGLDMEQFGFLGESPIFDMTEDDDPYANPTDVRRLNDTFIVPPFSVLDTRQGYWQDRKSAWLKKTGNLSETRDGDFGRTFDGDLVQKIHNGTSNFDPVLCEIIYHWFNRPGGKILDPFGGEQTKGVVAGVMGYPYHAVEIRKEQVDLNKKKTARYPNVNYYCGDSNELAKIVKERDFDLMFTSPPYYDLEVYSADDMSALGTYEEFMDAYRNIFTQVYDMMADDSFAVVKVGEIRNKATGEYRSFVPDNIRIFTDIGFHYYNEIILVNSVGTAQIRARKQMASRKIVKLHQNVLVFYKGDLKNITSNYPLLKDWDDENATIPSQEDTELYY